MPPVYARDIWGSPTAFGALVSGIGAGALIGSAVFGAIGHRMPRRLTFLLGGAGGIVLLYGGLALTPPLGLMLLLALVGATVAGPIVPLIFTVVQTITPAEVYGRVFGSLQSVTAAAAPFVIATVGFVIEGRPRAHQHGPGRDLSRPDPRHALQSGLAPDGRRPRPELEQGRLRPEAGCSRGLTLPAVRSSWATAS